MKHFVLVYILLISSAFAGHLETVCKSAKQPFPGRTNSWYSNPPRFSQNYLTRRSIDQDGTRFVLESFNGDEVFESQDALKGVIEFAGALWLLTDYELLHLSLEGELLNRYAFVFNPNPDTKKAMAFSLAEELILIARGSAGLTAFNPRTGKVQWHSEMTEVAGSRPVSVAFDGDNAQVIMTGTREGGFNGIATVELESGKVIGQTAYNIRRAGVISPDASAGWYKDSLVLNNGGWIHIISKKQLEEQKPIRPRWLAVEVGDDMHLHYMMLTGDFFFKDENLYGCGVYNERNGDEINRLARLFEVKMD